jgi:hypothetical protein
MKKRIIPILLMLTLYIASIPATALAASYTATIAQGNTTDVSDCKAMYDWLKQVPTGNTYTITNKGWTYSGSGTASANQQRATASDLINAKSKTVLYWSGHGSSNPLRLNVTASVQGGTFSTINVADTLGVDGDDWATASEWTTNDEIKVAIFGACKILDNTYDEVKYLVRLMKASNVRVIAGYHDTSPTHPTDTAITNDFFSNSTGEGVSEGDSVRYSWQLANEENSASAKWAVLCYKSNSNQYYRMPGFPGNTYAAPAAGSTVYRYWNSYKDNGQTMNTVSGITQPNLAQTPMELTLSAETLTVNQTAVSSAISGSSMPASRVSTQITSREMVESIEGLDEWIQAEIAADFIEDAINGNALSNAHISEFEVICEEIDPDDGFVEGSETVVGNTYCYSNRYNGIRIADSFVKVGTDADGVYFFINNWKNVELPLITNGNSQPGTNKTLTPLTLAEAVEALGVSASDIERYEIVYAPTANGVYKLSYEITLTDGTVSYVSCQTGDVF